MFSPHLLYADGSPARGVSVREGAVTDSDGILAGPTERIGPAGTIGRGLWVGVSIDYPYTPRTNGPQKIENVQAN
jgi:hypothetical protein